MRDGYLSQVLTRVLVLFYATHINTILISLARRRFCPCRHCDACTVAVSYNFPKTHTHTFFNLIHMLYKRFQIQHSAHNPQLASFAKRHIGFSVCPQRLGAHTNSKPRRVCTRAPSHKSHIINANLMLFTNISAALPRSYKLIILDATRGGRARSRCPCPYSCVCVRVASTSEGRVHVHAALARMPQRIARIVCECECVRSVRTGRFSDITRRLRSRRESAHNNASHAAHAKNAHQ